MTEIWGCRLWGGAGSIVDDTSSTNPDSNSNTPMSDHDPPFDKSHIVTTQNLNLKLNYKTQTGDKLDRSL